MKIDVLYIKDTYEIQLCWANFFFRIKISIRISLWNLKPKNDALYINDNHHIRSHPQSFCQNQNPVQDQDQEFTLNFTIRTTFVASKTHTTFYLDPVTFSRVLASIHGENFMAIFTTLSVVIWFSTGTLGIFAALVYVFNMRVVIYDILSMTIIPTLSTSILFCNLCYILLWISPRSVVKIAIRM